MSLSYRNSSKYSAVASAALRPEPGTSSALRMYWNGRPSRNRIKIIDYFMDCRLLAAKVKSLQINPRASGISLILPFSEVAEKALFLVVPVPQSGTVNVPPSAGLVAVRGHPVAVDCFVVNLPGVRTRRKTLSRGIWLILAPASGWMVEADSSSGRSPTAFMMPAAPPGPRRSAKERS